MSWIVSTIASLLAWRRVDVSRQISREGVEDDEVVQAYDRVNRWPQFRFLRWTIIRELKKHHPQGVLADVGCGPGYLIASMVRSFPDLSIIGVDIAEEMLQKAAENLSSLGLAREVSFCQGDIHELPFEDDCLDFVVSTGSLHHWSEPTRAIKEVHRVLKLGGEFLIFDLRRDNPRLAYWIVRFVQVFIAPAALGRINEPTGSFLASYTPAELEALLPTIPFEEWWIQPGLVWVFVWGRKSRP